jgi:Rrf2 family nitric oxide-sensitive transcriptional repressor
MHLTRFTDYSLRTLIYVGLQGERRASIAEIARAYAISEHHLNKVVHHLGQIGLLETVRGRNGGIRLARPAEQIRIGAVVREVEGHMAVMECRGTEPCAIAGVCVLERALWEGLAAFLAVLDKYTLADLLAARRDALSARLHLEAIPGMALAEPAGEPRS